MIELHSIDVHNFRAFTQARFEPSLDGMTAISGGNGAGKSSLIHALLWALYGITPDGVAVRGLRKENTTEPVMATVEFRHDDQTVVDALYRDTMCRDGFCCSRGGYRHRDANGKTLSRRRK